MEENRKVYTNFFLEVCGQRLHFSLSLGVDSIAYYSWRMGADRRRNDDADIYTDGPEEQFPKDQFDEFPEDQGNFESFPSDDSNPVNPAAEKLEVYHYKEPGPSQAPKHEVKILSEQEAIKRIGLERYCLALGVTNAISGKRLVHFFF